MDKIDRIMEELGFEKIKVPCLGKYGTMVRYITHTSPYSSSISKHIIKNIIFKYNWMVKSGVNSKPKIKNKY